MNEAESDKKKITRSVGVFDSWYSPSSQAHSPKLWNKALNSPSSSTRSLRKSRSMGFQSHLIKTIRSWRSTSYYLILIEDLLRLRSFLKSRSDWSWSKFTVSGMVRGRKSWRSSLVHHSHLKWRGSRSMRWGLTFDDRYRYEMGCLLRKQEPQELSSDGEEWRLWLVGPPLVVVQVLRGCFFA